jgi:hypothetical protein
MAMIAIMHLVSRNISALPAIGPTEARADSGKIAERLGETQFFISSSTHLANDSQR